MYNFFKQLTDPASFLDSLLVELTKDSIDVSHYKLDHICYRVETTLRYQELKNNISEKASLISEKIVNGQPIAIFKLDKPIAYQGWHIPCLELPAPIENKPYKEGWEHIEFVINEPLENFMARYPEKELIKHNLKMQKNPTIALKYGSNAVKFHLTDIEQIVLKE